jgi:hypothetical protein
VVRDEVADGVIAAVSTLVGSAAAWFVVGDADTEHASFAKERVVVVDNIDVNDGGGGGERGVAVSRAGSGGQRFGAL